MIKVSVDMKRGVYLIRGDGEDKVVEMPIKGHYDKSTVNTIREEIKKPRRFIPSEKLKLVDVGVYNALREYDRKYETDYANKYVDVTTKQISYSSVIDKNNRNYEKRQTEIKSREFESNGIDVEYNLSLFSGFGNMSIKDRFQAFKSALVQRKNGVRVQFKNDKQLLLEAPAQDLKVEEVENPIIQNVMQSASRTEEREEVIEAVEPKTIVPNSPSFEEIMGISPLLPKMATSKKIEELKEIPEISVTPGIEEPPVTSVPPVHIPVPEPPVQTINQTPEPLVPPVIEGTQPQIIQEGVSDNTVALNVSGGKEFNHKSGESKNLQLQGKKKISRSKAIQAAKKAERESKQMKNLYQAKIKAKAEKRKLAEEREKLGPKPKKEKQQGPQPPKQTPPVPPTPPKPPVRKPERVKPNVIASLRNIVLSKETIQQGKMQVSRFTGKIKEKAGKVYSNKLKPHKRTIARATTLLAGVALTTAIVATGARLATNVLENYNTNIEPDAPKIEQVVQVSQENIQHEAINRADFKDIRHTMNREGNNQEHTVADETQATIEQEAEKETPPVKEQEQQTGQERQDDTKQYLSSIKVGAALNINNGKFFETPEGQGNYGRFENYTDGVKTISMIEIMTRDGYKIVKDSESNLYQLKQQYPDAKFSYHIVFERTDGTKTTLGWLTEDSLEQNQQRVEQQFEIDDER